MDAHFFATISRMKYIERWALMRSSRPENLSEHSLEVAMIAHCLAVIGNVRYGRQLDADQAALIGLYHDASEIITGDMPTPVKYYNSEIRGAYREVESVANERLLSLLPDDLKPVYEMILTGCGVRTDDERYLRRLVKAADKISALIKCIEEERSGNQEFGMAKVSTEKAIAKIAQELPEVDDFVKEFLPSYGKTLDELTNRL
ncbi:MAG: 5'-deoxynucleotidase [Eubacterium sp.]|nr:5'-deoxynucleotidase [Eubacterium sp.]